MLQTLGRLPPVSPMDVVSTIVQRADASFNISQLPACALSCISSRCDTTNRTCICAHNGYRSDMTGCMFQACRLGDAMFSRNWTATLCDEPIRNQAVEFGLINWLLGGTLISIVIARLVFKRFFSATKRLGAEDWTIVAAALVSIASSMVQVFLLTPSGLGQDVWRITIPQLVGFGKYFYTMEIIYLIIITLVKTCLSLFYLGVFPGRGMRLLLWCTVGFHIAAGLAFILKTMFQCRPLAYNWTKYNGDPVTHGHCIDIHASGWANGILGVVADVWLIVLPMTQLQKLQLHWKKKVGAAIMFMTGGLVTIVSAFRLRSFTYFANTYNPTWDNWGVIFWSTVEVCVAVVCCCLPTVRLILIKLYPRAFFETKISRSRTRSSRLSGTGSSSGGRRRTSLAHYAAADYDKLYDGNHPSRGGKWVVVHDGQVQRGGSETDLEAGEGGGGGAGQGHARIGRLPGLPREEDCFELTTGAGARGMKEDGSGGEGGW